MPLFNVIHLPPFQAILVEAWNAPAHRYFLSYRIVDEFRHVMGLPVVDEFATFSTPIFVGPKSVLGELYDAGITLGHLRNPEMPLDQGWPPICVGIDSTAQLPDHWQEDLLNLIQANRHEPPAKSDQSKIQQHIYGDVTFLATDLPLLPRQLQQLCRLGETPLTISFSTGNRITATDGKLLDLRAASQATFEQLLHRFSTTRTGA